MTMLLCLAGISCDDEPSDIIIKTCRECGWCVGRDSLTIRKSNSSYAFHSPCSGIDDKNRHVKTDATKWNQLVASLDWNEFNKVQVNTCAVCADGCDTWISVEKNHETHRIRFTESSTEIEAIRPFVESLDFLIEEFRKN
jgi:hypothetical protein